MINGIFGDISLPPQLDPYGSLTEAGKPGIVGLLNNILKLITLAAGLFAIVNFILAGYGIMSAGGEPEKMGKAQSKIWYSILGLVIIVASFAIAALLGWLLFKDSGALLNIKIYGPP